MEQKIPNLVIYWADTRELLTYAERMAVIGGATLVDLTPLEILVMPRFTERVVVIRGITDSFAPQPSLAG